jgi:phosphoglucosamine mutase
VDGDQLLYVLANARNESNSLVGPVVGTLMSNLGLEKALASKGIEFVRAPVGDRYVREMLQEKGGQLGGEASGHIMVLDKTTTGDGLVSALQVLAVITESGRSLAELVQDMPRYPQTLINVRTSAKVDISKTESIRQAVEKVEQRLADRGRVLLRASGTEPVIRVMVEGEDETEVASLAEELAESVRRTAAG